MSGVLLELRTGLKMQHVPYRATPAGIMAVVNGEVQMGLFNTPTVARPDPAGTLKALAVTSEKRSTLLPELPTMIEAGVKDYVVDTWMGFAAPAGVPDAVAVRLNAELNRIAYLPADPREDAGPGNRSPARGPAGRGAKGREGRPRPLAADHQGVRGVGGIASRR